jgi:membrane protease subunit (stomatin/prohibitin family)
MGLIRAVTSSVSSTFGDQFKEFITCPTIEKDVIIQRGVTSHGEGNRNYSEGVISNGSTIAVPERMAMMIIENGAIKEFTSEAGTYTFDTSSEPSIFTGGLGKGIIDSIKNIGNRITFGGQTAKDQRVYYVNLLTITGNKFGSAEPQFIEDVKYGNLSVTFNGEYAFKVVDPALLVNEVVGSNPKDTLTYEDVVGGQLKIKFSEKMTEAISVVMVKNGVSFGKIGMYNTDIANQMNTCLNSSWKEKYGLEVTDVAIRMNLTDESKEQVSAYDVQEKQLNIERQKGQMFSENMSGMVTAGVTEATKTAAGNENGAMMGFMGMGMAGAQGASMMNTAMTGSNISAPQADVTAPTPGTIFAGAVTEEPKQSLAFCPDCGATKVGKFCTQCGKKLD